MTPAEPSRKKNRARSLPKARMEMQDSFFRRMGAAQQLIHLMDVVPGICFFIKDEHSRLIWVSRGILKRLGLSDSSELPGRQDHEFFPPQIAKMFVMDDRKVMRSGKPLLNRVELCYNEQRLLDWFVTTKLPIRDHSGHIIGIMGMMQSCSDRRRILFADSQITKALDYIRTHNRFPIRIGTLARASGASPRNLLRKFQREFRISVQEPQSLR